MDDGNEEKEDAASDTGRSDDTNNSTYNAALAALQDDCNHEPFDYNMHDASDCSLLTLSPTIAPMKVAIAGPRIELTHSNREHIAKLPLAFGFTIPNTDKETCHANDHIASKQQASASSKDWYNRGKQLVALEVGNIGMKNLGHTCYLSASVQTLFGIPSIITDLYRMYAEVWSANTSGDNETMPLTRALLEVAVDAGVLAEEDASCIRPEAAESDGCSTLLAANPSALKKQMDVLTNKFAG